jgi:hypothetical protein
MGRGLKLGLGIPLLIVGVGVTLVGVALMVVVGPDGSFTTPETQVRTDGAALVFDSVTIRGRLPQEGSLATTIGIQVRSASDVFVGVGSAGDVQRYLSGVPIDLVRELQWSNNALKTVSIPGSRSPKPPGDVSFWLESSEGSGVRTIDWTISTGDWRVVVMNADGSPGLDVVGSASVHLAALGWISVGVLIFGLVVLAAGFVLTVAGTRTPRKEEVAAVSAFDPPATSSDLPPPPPTRPDP